MSWNSWKCPGLPWALEAAPYCRPDPSGLLVGRSRASRWLFRLVSYHWTLCLGSPLSPGDLYEMPSRQANLAEIFIYHPQAGSKLNLGRGTRTFVFSLPVRILELLLITAVSCLTLGGSGASIVPGHFLQKDKSVKIITLFEAHFIDINWLFFLIPESPQRNGESGSALWGWLGGPGAPAFQVLQLRVHATSNGTNSHMGQLLELQK